MIEIIKAHHFNIHTEFVCWHLNKSLYHIIGQKCFTCKMAQIISPGDVVLFKEALHVVKSKDCLLGYGQFVLTSLDTGEDFLAFRHQIDIPDITTLTNVQDLFSDIAEPEGTSFEETPSAEPQQTASHNVEPEPSTSGLFKSVTNEDLQHLQSCMTSKSTDNQTRWVVKMMKGSYKLYFICFLLVTLSTETFICFVKYVGSNRQNKSVKFMHELQLSKNVNTKQLRRT